MKQLGYALIIWACLVGTASGSDDEPVAVETEALNCLPSSSSSSSSSSTMAVETGVINEACVPVGDPCTWKSSYQADAVIETVGCAEFLEEYTNPDQQELPVDRIYPNGQKMMIAAWLAKSEGDIKMLADSGFTMIGPIWDTRDISYLNRAHALGLKAAHKITDTAGTSVKLQKRLATAEGEAGVWREVEKRIKAVVDDPVYNDTVEVWLQGSEELSTRRFDGDLAYIQKFRDMISIHDPKQRPLWMSDVTGVSVNQMIDTHWWLDMIGPQMYLERIGRPGFYQHNAIINKLVCNVVTTAEMLDTNYPLPHKRPATVSFGALYEPTPERDSAEFINKVVEHDLYLALNNGLQGFQIYSWYNYTFDGASDTTTWNWYKDAWYKHVKRLTDYELDDAYLWGDRRHDLRLEILRGPERMQWTQGSTNHDYPSISMQNIQYGSKRYVILTNSNTEAVQVEVSGFPTGCITSLDIREGKYQANNGAIKVTLQPLDVRLYRFESRDGG